jgi:hypothetical protein
MAAPLGREVKALLFFAGFEIGYQVNGSGCSSPQTTELRVGGAEGGGAAEKTLMKWVHKSTAVTLTVTLGMSLLAGNLWAFFGALVSVFDMEGSYWYAKRCGRWMAGQPTATMSQRARGSDTSYTGAAVPENISLRSGATDLPTSGGQPLRTR